jgi:hypothetical protein
MLAYRVAITDRFIKTETGRQEIRAPVHALSRSARNLLLIVDGTRPASEWLAMVHGATAQDLEDLMAAQLVEPVGGGEGSEPAQRAPGGVARAEPRAPVREAAPVPAPTPAPAPVPAAEALGYQELYAALNAMAREQLGLIKGYRFSLEIERASGLAEMEEVAHRFVQEVQKAHGDAAARQVRRALRLTH